jgi:hypothetical protein
VKGRDGPYDDRILIDMRESIYRVSHEVFDYTRQFSIDGIGPNVFMIGGS